MRQDNQHLACVYGAVRRSCSFVNCLRQGAGPSAQLCFSETQVLERLPRCVVGSMWTKVQSQIQARVGVETGSEAKSAGERSKRSDGIRIFEGRLVQFNLAPTIARQLTGRRTTFRYSKGEVVFFSGAAADMVYCVRKGMVALYAPEENGNRVMVRIAGPGDLLGYTNVLGEERSKHLWEAHARSNCELAVIKRDHITRTLQLVDREVLLQLFDRINTEWSQQVERWVSFLGLDYRQRLTRVINELAERFGTAEARGILLVPEFTHSDFAEMIASSRPMASKLMSELIEEGVFIQEGRQHIVPIK